MAISLGLDLGTTTITTLAIDVADGQIGARFTLRNDAEVTATEERIRGRSEWDAAGIAAVATRVLRSLVESLGARVKEVAGLGLTGQQHGVVLVDQRSQLRRPRSIG